MNQQEAEDIKINLLQRILEELAWQHEYIIERDLLMSYDVENGKVLRPKYEWKTLAEVGVKK